MLELTEGAIANLERDGSSIFTFNMVSVVAGVWLVWGGYAGNWRT
jgi:hypothetical protein